MSYGLITEEIFFALALTLTRVGGAFDVALATAEVITPVMAAMNDFSAVGETTGVFFLCSLLCFLLPVLFLLRGP